MSGSGRPLYEPNPAATAAGVRYDVERLKRRGIALHWEDLDLSVGDWANEGPPKPNARWTYLPGYDLESGDPHFMIELAVTGGTPGSLIAMLPFTLSTDKPTQVGWDTSAGAPRAYTILANGSIMDGAA